MKKPNRKQICSLVVAALVAALFLIILYQVANYRIPITDEKGKLQLFEKIRAICFGMPFGLCLMLYRSKCIQENGMVIKEKKRNLYWFHGLLVFVHDVVE